jgi:hypothetical protein
MAITSGINIVFKKDVMLEQHNLPSDTLRIALVSSSASASNGGPDTIASISGEISGTSDGSGASGYITGGVTVTDVTVTNVSSSGVVDFSDVSFTSVTFTARGAILYNATNSNKVIAVYDFGGDKTVTNGTFQLTIPSATSAAAIVRLN